MFTQLLKDQIQISGNKLKHILLEKQELCKNKLLFNSKCENSNFQRY